MQYRFRLVAAVVLAGCRNPQDIAAAPDARGGSATPPAPHYAAAGHLHAQLPLQDLARARQAAAKGRDEGQEAKAAPRSDAHCGLVLLVPIRQRYTR